MNKNAMLVIATIAMVTVITATAFLLLNASKWNDYVDDWVLDQEVHEGDYIEYADRFTVESVDGERCAVRKNNDSGTVEMSKKEFLSMLSARHQLNQYFEGYDYYVTIHNEESLEDGVTVYEGHIHTDIFGTMEEYDAFLYIGSHNILLSWDLEDIDSYILDTNLSFVDE